MESRLQSAYADIVRSVTKQADSDALSDALVTVVILTVRTGCRLSSHGFSPSCSGWLAGWCREPALLHEAYRLTGSVNNNYYNYYASKRLMIARLGGEKRDSIQTRRGWEAICSLISGPVRPIRR